MSTRKQPQQTEETAQLLLRLAEAVERLADEVHILRDVFDEVRDDLAWALNNDRLRPARTHVPIVPLTSMPRDPLAADFGERINRFGPADLLDVEQPVETAPGKHARQQDLFREEGGS